MLALALFLLSTVLLAAGRSASLGKARGRQSIPGADKWSNAKRIANGLLPRSPLSYGGEAPTRVLRARSPHGSGLPPCTAPITVVAATDTSNVLGYVSSKTYNGIFTVDDYSNALIVAFDCTGASGPLDLAIQNGYYAGSSTPYLGLTYQVDQDTGNEVLSLTSFNTVVFSAVASTSADSPPQGVANSYDNGIGAESAIWTFNQDTFQLTPEWINTGGSPGTTIPVENPYGFLLATGNVALSDAEFEGGAISTPILFFAAFQP